MGLDDPAVLGGRFLNLKELVANGPQLVIFRIKKFLPPAPAKGTFIGTNVPVIADAVIVSGPRTGELWRDAEWIAGITAALRGVHNPNKDKGIGVLDPVTKVGAEMLVLVKARGQGVVGDPAPPEAKAHAHKVYAELGAEKLWDRDDLLAVGSEEPELASVGAAASTSAEPAAQESWKADRPAWG